MPIQLLEQDNYQFNKGLFTEASALLRPEGTSIDEEDFIINRDGSRSRRYGWKEMPTSTILSDTGLTDFRDTNVGYWNNPGFSYAYPIVVVRIGNHLYFFADRKNDLQPFPFNERIDLRNHRVDRTTTDVGDIEFAEGNAGYFFITGEDIFPIYLNYENVNIISARDQIVAREVNVMERDLEGDEDGFGASTQPIVNDTRHRYNLYNSGWSLADINTFFGLYAKYPSKSMIWHYGIITTPATGQEAFNAQTLVTQNFGNTDAPRGKMMQHVNFHENVTDFSQSYRIITATYQFGTTEVEILHTDNVTYLVGDMVYIRGVHFAYYDDSAEYRFISLHGYYAVSTVVGVSQIRVNFTLPNKTAGTNITTISYQKATIASALFSKPTQVNGFQDINKGFRAIAFHAGRVWYAGMDDVDRNIYGKRIFFSSSTAVDGVEFGRCHSINDPTNRNVNEPLETDGGYIEVPEMDTVRKLQSMGNYLIVFADNGVWAIVPGEQGYFTATSFGVHRISDVGITSKESVIYANGAVFFWGVGGIYTVVVDDVTSIPAARSITDTTIKSLILSVETDAGVHGTYDKEANIVYWLYSDGTITSGNDQLNKILVLDLIGQAFYKLSVPRTYEDANNQSVPMTILCTEALNSLPASGIQIDKSIKRLRLLRANLDTTLGEEIGWYLSGAQFTYGQTYEQIVWKDESPVARFESEGIPYLTTSYEYGTGPDKEKWGKEVLCFFTRTEDAAEVDATGVTLYNKSSCLLRARWEFADTGVSNKWSSQNQAYRQQRVRLPTGANPGVYAYDNGYPVVKTRNSIRGSGSVLSLRFDGETEKDCKLLGWHIDMLETADTR